MAAQTLDAAAAALLQELGHADVSVGTWPARGLSEKFLTFLQGSTVQEPILLLSV